MFYDRIDEERRELERQKSEWKLQIAAEQQRIERIRATANRKLAEATSNQTLASTTQKNIQAIVDAETQAALKDREATAVLRASVEREQELVKHQAVELSQQKSQAEARMYEISSLGEQVRLWFCMFELEKFTYKNCRFTLKLLMFEGSDCNPSSS